MKNSVNNIEFQLTLFKFLALGFFISGILIPIIWLWIKGINSWNLQTMQNWGLLGDFFWGTTGTLWAAAGACVVYMAFLWQMLEIKTAQKQIEQNERKETQKDINNLISDLENCANEIRWHFVQQPRIINLFRFLLEIFQTEHVRTQKNSINNSEIKSHFGRFLWNGSGPYLDKFFRILIRILENLEKNISKDFKDEKNLVLSDTYGLWFKELFFYYLIYKNNLESINLIKNNNFLQWVNSDLFLSHEDKIIFENLFHNK